MAIAQDNLRKVRIMKKFGFLALALSLSVYSLGCGKTDTTTPPADGGAAGTSTETPAADGSGTATDTPAADGAAAEGEHDHAEGEADHADEAAK
jgi:hypothetical protein